MIEKFTDKEKQQLLTELLEWKEKIENKKFEIDIREFKSLCATIFDKNSHIQFISFSLLSCTSDGIGVTDYIAFLNDKNREVNNVDVTNDELSTLEELTPKKYCWTKADAADSEYSDFGYYDYKVIDRELNIQEVYVD